MNDKWKKKYLELFMDTIQEVATTQRLIYKDLVELRDYFMEQNNIDAYMKVAGQLSEDISQNTGKLSFLTDAFSRFVEENYPDEEGAEE